MELKIEGVHYHLSEKTQEFVEQKLGGLHHEDCLQDIRVTITQNSNESFDLKANIHFRWHEVDHVEAKNERELYPGIDTLVEKILHLVDKQAGKHMAHHDHKKQDRHHASALFNEES